MPTLSFLTANMVLRHLLNDVPAIGTSTIAPASRGWNRNAPARGFPLPLGRLCPIGMPDVYVGITGRFGEEYAPGRRSARHDRALRGQGKLGGKNERRG
jgi:hypothetical protein